MAGRVPDVGIYLVDIAAEDWTQGRHALLLNQALAARHLPPYPGPPAPRRDFEEKLIPPMTEFGALCDRHGAGDILSASLIVPVDFTGLIELPAENSFDDVTVVLSAHRLREAVAPIAVEAGLPADLPIGPMALTNEFDDPITFYTALFQQAAQHSLEHHCPLTYV